MKKKPKTQVYIPHQDKWNEHFPTPGKPNPNYYTDSGVPSNTLPHQQTKIPIHHPSNHTGDIPIRDYNPKVPPNITHPYPKQNK